MGLLSPPPPPLPPLPNIHSYLCFGLKTEITAVLRSYFPSSPGRREGEGGGEREESFFLYAKRKSFSPPSPLRSFSPLPLPSLSLPPKSYHMITNTRVEDRQYYEGALSPSGGVGRGKRQWWGRRIREQEEGETEGGRKRREMSRMAGVLEGKKGGRGRQRKEEEEERVGETGFKMRDKEGGKEEEKKKKIVRKKERKRERRERK